MVQGKSVGFVLQERNFNNVNKDMPKPGVASEGLKLINSYSCACPDSYWEIPYFINNFPVLPVVFPAIA